MATPLRFDALRRGMEVKVTRICEDCDETLRLRELGLTAGSEFRVVKVAPLNDPIEIDLRGYRLCLRRAEAGGFDLELLR